MPWDSKYSVPWDENDLGKQDGQIEIFLFHYQCMASNGPMFLSYVWNDARTNLLVMVRSSEVRTIHPHIPLRALKEWAGW